jgi:NTP pyrophosphatase (non-canonical NTP hydrolase)
MNINWDILARQLHDTAEKKGFWEPLDRMDKQDEFVFFAKQIAMIHSEATEVLEALRKDKGEEAVVEELADIIIRTFDLWAGLEKRGVVTSSLDQVMIKKMNINVERPRLHGVKG